MAAPYTSLQLPQDRETPVQAGRRPGFAWRYAYARAAEAIAAGERGQDSLTLRHGDGTVVFALCDGVSQSFFGDLAARFLSERLVEWLWSALAGSIDGPTLRVALAEHLRALTGPATAQVQAQALPATLAPLLREVLEAKRAGGSESTFVGGRIDLPGAAVPAGRVVLVWMGDSRLRLWGPAGEITTELGDSFRTAQRWSSRRGPVNGEPTVLVAPVGRGDRRRLDRLLAYSDGLAALDALARAPADAELNDLIARTSQAATSDDVCLLELRLEELPARAAPR